MAETSGNRPPTLRDQQRIFTRGRLIESAIQCFGQRGYHATKIEDIVAAAGASRATFYLHFNSKLEVLDEAMAALDPEAERRYNELDAEIAKPGGVTRKALSRWLDDWVDFWEEHGPLIIAAHQSVVIEPGRLQHDWEGRMRLAGMLVHYHNRFQGGARETAKLRALLLEQLSDRAFHLYINPVIDLTREQLVEVLTEYWWMVLHDDPAPEPKTHAKRRAPR